MKSEKFPKKVKKKRFSSVEELCRTIYPEWEIVENKGLQKKSCCYILKSAVCAMVILKNENVKKTIWYYKCDRCGIIEGLPSQRNFSGYASGLGADGFAYHCSMCNAYLYSIRTIMT